eukprot:1015188_1
MPTVIDALYRYVAVDLDTANVIAKREAEKRKRNEQKRKKKELMELKNALPNLVIELNDSDHQIIPIDPPIDPEINKELSPNHQTSSDIVVASNVHNNHKSKVNPDAVVKKKKKKKHKNVCEDAAMSQIDHELNEKVNDKKRRALKGHDDGPPKKKRKISEREGDLQKIKPF